MLTQWLMAAALAGGGGGGGGSLLLDTYTGATAAYSLRKLRTAYSGAAIRVLRFSDSAELDIGFDGSNDLNTSALTGFIGSSTGIIIAWYDQSGSGNNATATAGGPTIINTGTLVTLGGKPAISATSSQAFTLTTPLATVSGGAGSWWHIYHKNTTGNQAILLTSGGSYMWIDEGATQYVSGSGTVSISPTFSPDTRYLVNCVQVYDTAATMYSNGASIGSRGSSIGPAGLTYLPSNASRTATMLLQEFIFFPSDKSSDRAAITSNINTYWSIY